MQRANTKKDETKIACMLRVNVTESQHLDAIREFVADMMGEICWKARLGYGDELKLEIGDKVDSGFPDHRIWGAWMLGGMGTGWKPVNENGEVVASDTLDLDPPEDTGQKLQVIVNTRIVALEPHFPDLGVTITFDNRYELTILPTPEDDQYELSYWELFTPRGLLEVGPRSTYSCTSWVK